jgi:hypothetical protein
MSQVTCKKLEGETSPKQADKENICGNSLIYDDPIE